LPLPTNPKNQMSSFSIPTIKELLMPVVTDQKIFKLQTWTDLQSMESASLKLMRIPFVALRVLLS
jgi:hypothetical protein